MKQKLILIGSGMVGVRFLDFLLKIPPEQYDTSLYHSPPFVLGSSVCGGVVPLKGNNLYYINHLVISRY